MTNKIRVEILNYSTQTWVDVTQDVQMVDVAGLGLKADPGQTSPRGNVAPATAKAGIVLNNAWNSQFGSGGYNPNINGLIWPRNPVRVRCSGASLGNCLQAYATGSQDAASFSQLVTVGVAINDVFVLQWGARCSDPRYDNDNVYIKTSAEQQVWQFQTYTNKWKTYSISFTATQVGTTVTPFFQPNSAPGSNVSTVEYRNVTLKKNGGANLLVNGDFATGLVTPWVANNVNPTTNWALGDATFGVLGLTTRLSGTSLSTITLAVVPDTWIVFYGLINKVDPHMHIKAGDLLCVLTVKDLTTLLETRSLNLPPQINQRGDQIMTTLYNQFQAGKFPGSLFDTGITTFAYAFDGYVYGSTHVWDAVRDTALSENGRAWVDRDGTLRFYNRQALLNAVTKPIKLTLTDGLAYTGHVTTTDDLLANDISISVTPRLTGTSSVQLVQLTAPVPIPPTPAGTTPVPVTVTFVDATGKTIGGANVYPPVYAINTKSDGSGIDMTTQTTQVTLQSQQVSASQATYNFVNNTNQTLYLVSLTVSGLQVTTNNVITAVASDAAAIARYEDAPFKKMLPFGSDLGFALTLAQYYLNRYKDPFPEVDYIQVDNKTVLNSVDLLSLELFDVISVSDAQSGVSAQLYAIVSIDYTLGVDGTDGLKTIRFTLERLDAATYWILGDATYGQLGNTTRLAI